jgi:hypothetical protein
MRKIKKLLFGGLFCLGVAFMFNSAESKAQGVGPLPGNWICCAANSSGCTDRLGDRWDTDERRVASTCTDDPSIG